MTLPLHARVVVQDHTRLVREAWHTRVPASFALALLSASAAMLAATPLRAAQTQLWRESCTPGALQVRPGSLLVGTLDLSLCSPPAQAPSVVCCIARASPHYLGVA